MVQVAQYLTDLQTVIQQLNHDAIMQAIDWLHNARLNRCRIFIMGNGGSASTATHFTCDLNKNTQYGSLPDFMVTCLSDNIALMTAYANDEGYDSVFAKQLKSFCQRDDLVVAISTSGNSTNVIQAIKMAKQLDARTIGMTGFDGGLLRDLVDLELHVPTNSIEHVEDIHLALEHLMTKTLREMGQQSIMGEID